MANNDGIRNPTDIESFFGQLRPGRFGSIAGMNPSPAMVSAERQVGPGEVQPTGWVQNNDATVIIDEEGITIEDGALTLRDPSGETVMTGAGFSGSWQRFMASGLYNSNFSRVLDATVDVHPTTVPYWDSNLSPSTANLQVRPVLDATAPGGYYIDMGAKAGGEPDVPTFAVLYQSDIPVVSGQTYEVRVTKKIDASSTYKLGFYAEVYWYDSAGVIISNEYLEREWSTSVTTWTEFLLLTTTAPTNAATALVRLIARDHSVWTATLPRAKIAEASFRRVVVTPGRSVTKTTAESIPNNTWTRIAAYQVTDFNQGGIDWSTHGLGVFTVQHPGFYLVHAFGGFDTNATGDRYVALTFANAATPATIPDNEYRRMRPAGAGNAPIEINVIRYFNVLDTISLSVHQASGGALNLYTARISAMRLG